MTILFINDVLYLFEKRKIIAYKRSWLQGLHSRNPYCPNYDSYDFKITMIKKNKILIHQTNHYNQINLYRAQSKYHGSDIDDSLLPCYPSSPFIHYSNNYSLPNQSNIAFKGFFIAICRHDINHIHIGIHTTRFIFKGAIPAFIIFIIC